MTGAKKTFWQRHSVRFLEMAFRVDRMEEISRPDGCGCRTGECGDTVEVFLQMDGQRLRRVTFQVRGCIHTVACANAVAELAEGKTLDEAWEISADQVSEFLETLPPEHNHCAELAVGAFYLALADVKRKIRQPWKRVYG